MPDNNVEESSPTNHSLCYSNDKEKNFAKPENLLAIVFIRSLNTIKF